MTLFPNIPFSDGDSWSPELAYQAFNAPVFDDQPQYLGHRIKMLDVELSDNAGQIKDRVKFLESSLKVTVEGGLTIRYGSGTIQLSDNNTISIVSGLIGVPDNQVSYIVVDIDGIPKVTGRVPVYSITLAKVTATNGVIVSVEDLRHPNQKVVRPASYAIKTFGGRSTTDKVTYDGEVLDQGYYYFQNFTVPAGTTCYIQGFARLFVAGYATIQGNLVVQPMAPGVPLMSFNVSSTGSIGDIPGSGLGCRGAAVPWSSATYGSGGGNGLIQSASTNAWGYLGKGGDGGGGLWIECANDIRVVNGGKISAIGGNANAGGNYLNGAIGGYTNAATIALGGSGGGSGGLILLSSLRSVVIDPGAKLYAYGGAGYQGVGVSLDGAKVVGLPGNGGSGGYIILQSPSNNVSGADIQLQGGDTSDVTIYRIDSGANYVTQPSQGVFRVVNPALVLRGGQGGAYGGNSRPIIVTATTEGGQPVQYFQKQVAESGKLLLQNFTPIGA